MNRISRRAFLKTSGLTGAALLAREASAGPAENSELCKLYAALPLMLDDLNRANVQLAAAEAEFNALAPKLPKALICKTHIGAGLAKPEQTPAEMTATPARRIYSSELIKQFHGVYTFRADHEADPEAIKMRRLYEMAEVYERSWHEARQRSGLPEALERRMLAVGAIREAAADAAKIAPETLEGLRMKAEILAAMASCGDRELMWYRRHHEQLASDILGVLQASKSSA